MPGRQISRQITLAVVTRTSGAQCCRKSSILQTKRHVLLWVAELLGVANSGIVLGAAPEKPVTLTDVGAAARVWAESGKAAGHAAGERVAAAGAAASAVCV